MESDLYRDMFENERRFWWFSARRLIAKDLIGRYAPKMGTLADLGCGCGYTLHAFSDFFEQVIGVDPAPEAIEFSKLRKIPVVQGSLPDAIPLEPGSFDVVLMMDVLEHVEDDGAAAAAAAKLLAPGGIIIATAPAHQWMWTLRDDHHHHKRRYSKKQFGALFKPLPLERLVLSYFNSVLFPVMALISVVSRWLKIDREGTIIKTPPEPINRILEWIFSTDRFFLGRVPIIWGGSVVGVYRNGPPPTPRK